MPTHADLAAKLLRDAAKFFRSLGENNPELKTDMEENADVFEQVADLVESDPDGELDSDDEGSSPITGLQ
jgi:hypothetical protein